MLDWCVGPGVAADKERTLKRSEIPDGVVTETGHETQLWIVIVHWDDDTASYGPFETQGFAQAWVDKFARSNPDVPTSLVPLFGQADRITEITRYNTDVQPGEHSKLARDLAEDQAKIRTGAGILTITVTTGGFGWCEDGDGE